MKYPKGLEDIMICFSEACIWFPEFYKGPRRWGESEPSDLENLHLNHIIHHPFSKLLELSIAAYCICWGVGGSWRLGLHAKLTFTYLIILKRLGIY